MISSRVLIPFLEFCKWNISPGFLLLLQLVKALIDFFHAKRIDLVYYLKRWKLADISLNTVQRLNDVVGINTITSHWKGKSSPGLIRNSLNIIPSIDRLSLQFLQYNIKGILSLCLCTFPEKRLILSTKLCPYVVSNMLTTIAWNSIRKHLFQGTR